jgi:hypothetical protein
MREAACRQCDDSVAAVPDWWQVRLGADRPQLLVSYARKFSDGTWDKAKYIVSIPHWSKGKDATQIGDFPVYDKGSYQGTRVFPDNSKLIVNCLTREESIRVLNKLSNGIDVSLVDRSETSVTDRNGRLLREIKVYPRKCSYYSSGQQNLEPDWKLDFR